MTRVVSVVTPAYRPVAEHLAAAYDSLRQQVMPAGWDWQWVVQEDGQSGALARMLPSDPRISADTKRPGYPHQSPGIKARREDAVSFISMDDPEHARQRRMVTAEFSINRKDFKVVYAGKPDDLIRDDVVLKLTLKAHKKG